MAVVFTCFYLRLKETTNLRTWNSLSGNDKRKQDFRRQHVLARFTRVQSHTRQFGEGHHTHSNSHSTTMMMVLWSFVVTISLFFCLGILHSSSTCCNLMGVELMSSGKLIPQRRSSALEDALCSRESVIGKENDFCLWSNV